MRERDGFGGFLKDKKKKILAAIGVAGAAGLLATHEMQPSSETKKEQVGMSKEKSAREGQTTLRDLESLTRERREASEGGADDESFEKPDTGHMEEAIFDLFPGIVDTREVGVIDTVKTGQYYLAHMGDEIAVSYMVDSSSSPMHTKSILTATAEEDGSYTLHSGPGVGEMGEHPYVNINVPDEVNLKESMQRLLDFNEKYDVANAQFSSSEDWKNSEDRRMAFEQRIQQYRELQDLCDRIDPKTGSYFLPLTPEGREAIKITIQLYEESLK